jgi:hypothetical protein
VYEEKIGNIYLMNAEQLIIKALNTLTRWQQEYDELESKPDTTLFVHREILEYALENIQYRKTAPVRHGIGLAYAILGLEEEK